MPLSTEMSWNRMIEPLEEVLTPDQRRDPELQRFLRRSMSDQMWVTLPSSTPTVFMFALMLSSSSPARPLMAWVGLVVSISVAFVAFMRTVGDEVDHRYWLPGIVGLQAATGLVWGVPTWFAMPTDEVWQAVLAIMLIGAYAAVLVFSAPLRIAFYAFSVPFVAATIPPFFLSGTEFGTFFGTFGVFAGLFGILLNRLSRHSFEEAALLALQNARLAERLETERRSLDQSNARLSERALRDPLTGALNRDGFFELLEATMPEDRHCAVVYLDIDRFKSINDRFGHEVGDQLLQITADRILTALPDDGELARLGGDELVVLLPRTADLDRAVGVAERIRREFRDPIAIGEGEIRISLSAGVARQDAGSLDADALLNGADRALYEAKESGRNRVVALDQDLQDRLRSQRDELEELQLGLQRGEIVPWIQPFVDLGSGAVVGGECLARWEHPDGVRPAGRFLPIAARAGLLDKISWHIIDQVRDHRVRDQELADVPLSVNVPPALAADLLTHRAGNTSDFAGLSFELTEDGTVDDLARTREVLVELRALGARVLLDDLGAGVAPLNLLTELPIDGVKIDRSVVAKIAESRSARAVVRSVVQLADELDLQVVAEGIETELHAEVLFQLGVRIGQGFLFDGAVPVATFHQRRADGYPSQDQRPVIAPSLVG